VEGWFTGVDINKGLGLDWQAINGAMAKGPLDEAEEGANPADHGKKDTKRVC